VSNVKRDPTLPGESPPNASPPHRATERYHVLAEHGRGGLGVVSRARDRDLGRDVAIKELLTRGRTGEARFLREARITARLEHPGIVPVYEAGRWTDGTPFYAMKLVSGRPLRELIAERRTVAERIRLLHHVIAVADAMAYAHARNIIHRDLKPANVIVGDFGETIVIDWGLAKDLTETDQAFAGEGWLRSVSDDDLTATGAVLGTPSYMAPEQEQGAPVDQRADVFTIGAMLWELCSLQKVPPTDIGHRHRLLRRAGIDRDLIAIVDKALEPDPDRRYRDAGALATDLKAFKAGVRIAARSYSRFGMVAHWTRRHRLIAVSAALVLALSIVGSVFYVRSVVAERVAAQVAVQADVEQGRAALLHGESADALLHLSRAYQHGDHSPGLEFMLARALQPRLAERARFAATSGRMWSAQFSPDGKRVVTSDDKAAQIWDAQTNRLLFTLPHGDIVYQAVYSTDGAKLLTAGSDGMVKIWDAASGGLVRELTQKRSDGKLSRYVRVAVSPDGKLVAAIDFMGDVAHVWDAATGAALAELRNDGSEYPSLAFSYDGHWLATSGGDIAELFNTSTWTQALTLAGPGIRSLSWDPTAPRLVTGTVRGEVSIWDVSAGARVRHMREVGEPIDAVSFAPNGEFVVTASRDGAEQVWNAGSGTLQSQGNYLHDRIFAVEFDPLSKLVVSAGANGVVAVADAALGMPLAVFDGAAGSVRAVHFDPTSRRIAGASWDGTARIWDASPPYRRSTSLPVGDSCTEAVSLVPDQRFVAVGCGDHQTHIWDTARDHLLAKLPPVTEVNGDFASAFPAVSGTGDRAAIARGKAVEIYGLPDGQLLRTIMHSAAVNAVAFASDGHDLVSGAVDGSLLVTQDGRDPVALPALSDGIDAAAILSDGRVVAADAGKRLRIYNLGRDTVLAELEVPTRIRMLRLAPDGHRLVAIARLTKVAPPTLWDLEHYRLIARLEGHLGLVYTARFMAGGEILTAGGDGTARLWSGTTGGLIQTYRARSRFFADATLSPDGSAIVAGGADGLLRFWDAASGRPLWTMLAHKSAVIGVHFDGDDLVTRGLAGDVSRWAFPNPAQVLEACNARESCALLLK